MEMKWSKLIDFNEQSLQRGYLLKFKSHYPFEDEVIMMVCEGGCCQKGLITISGYKAGINMYVLFPEDANPDGGISTKWLITNWTKWVWPESKLEDIFVRPQLNYNEI